MWVDINHTWVVMGHTWGQGFYGGFLELGPQGV